MILKNVSFSLLLFGLVALAHGDPTIDDAGRFVATFPGAVKQDNDVTNDASGDVKIHETIFASSTGTYGVTYCDIPVPASASINADEAYQAGIKRTVASNKGILRSQSKCKLGDVEGLEFYEDIPGVNAVIRCRMFLIGNRLYEVIWAGFLGSENSQGVVDFLDSFRVLK